MMMIEEMDGTSERIEKMKEYIEKNWIPVGKTSKHIYGSYGLKHELERSKWTDESNTYVANGELILADVLCWI